MVFNGLDKIPLSEVEVRRLYLDNKLNETQIGRRLGVSKTTIMRRLEEWEISKRSLAETIRLNGPNSGQIKTGQHLSPTTELKTGLIPKSRKLFFSKETFFDLYVTQGLSTIDVGSKFGVAAKTIQWWLKYFEIPIRSLSEARLMASLKGKVNGPAHPRWVGGRFPYRGPNWLEQRRKCLKRDGYMCQRPPCDSEDVDVHHLLPFRYFGLERYNEANALSNLITLCRSHHMKEEYR